MQVAVLELGAELFLMARWRYHRGTDDAEKRSWSKEDYTSSDGVSGGRRQCVQAKPSTPASIAAEAAANAPALPTLRMPDAQMPGQRQKVPEKVPHYTRTAETAKLATATKPTLATKAKGGGGCPWGVMSHLTALQDPEVLTPWF